MPNAENAAGGQLVAWHENISGHLAAADNARCLRSGASHNYQFVCGPDALDEERGGLQQYPTGSVDGAERGDGGDGTQAYADGMRAPSRTSAGVDYTEGPVYEIEDIGRKESGGAEVGIGVREGAMFTLNSAGKHGVGPLPVCFQQNTRDEVRLMNGDGDLAGCLPASPGMKQQNYIADSNPAIAFCERSRTGGRTVETQEDLAYALTNPGSGGRTHSRQILAPMDRIMNAISDEFLPKGLDSARYRACGNAVTVNVLYWLGLRIMCVDRMFAELEAEEQA